MFLSLLVFSPRTALIALLAAAVSLGFLLLISRFIIFGCICARQLLTVQSMYAEPLMEIFAQVFRLFPFNKFRHDGLVHALLPGNSSSHLIDGNFILHLL